jgi:adhesin/invasin
VKVTTAAADVYDSYLTVAAYTTVAAAATATFTAPAPATAAPTSVIIDGTTYAFTYATGAAHSIAIQGTSSVLSATAGANKFVAQVTDQYGLGIANVAVTVGVTGRNAKTTSTLGVTDANGLVSYTLTDAGTTGTLDTITFGASVSGTNSAGAAGSATAAATVTYGTVTVSTVTVSGGSKAETVAGSTPTAISAADNGPEGSAVAIKAVVKDANGNLLAGVPVTFTVDAGAIKKTAAIDYATVYTGSDGSATTYAFNWLAGKQTITATAGGKSGTDYLTWAGTDATTARVLSATATGDIVSLKVVDRFGNPVKGVSVNLSRTGTGLFGKARVIAVGSAGSYTGSRLFGLHIHDECSHRRFRTS